MRTFVVMIPGANIRVLGTHVEWRDGTVTVFSNEQPMAQFKQNCVYGWFESGLPNMSHEEALKLAADATLYAMERQ